MVVAPLDCGVRPHEWGWTSAMCRLPGWEHLCLLLVTGVGPCCSEGQCHMGSAWLWAACLLTGRAVFLFYWWFGVRHLALGLAGLWLGLGLSVEMTAFESPHELMLWGQGFSGGPRSWTQVSYFGRSGPIPYCSVKTSQASQHRRQSPRTNGERNPQQPRTPRQTCALTKRRGKKGKKG